jgi:hypothetical protein
VSRTVSVTLLLTMMMGCRSPVLSERGHLEASWLGADTGRLAGSAVGEWCDEQRRLEIRLIKGDTGLSLAVYPKVVLSPDTYRVAIAGSKDTTPPSSRLALRWLGPTAIHGFQGDSGTVVLQQTDSGQLTGSVIARASSVSNSDRVRLTGEFQNLAVVPQSRGCTAEPADSV